MTTLALICLALAGLYVAMTLANLLALRPPAAPPAGGPLPAVSVLIPARDEAANIRAAVDAALAAAEGLEAEVVVMDDGSSDGTGEIVAARAVQDPRVRLETGDGLPAGWNGKQHACWKLAQAARNPILVFVDADVRLAPGALARIAGRMERRRLDLLSGFPRQVTVTAAEKLVIPQILVVLLGYLPIPVSRTSRAQGFAAGCGQLMAVRREPYLAAGGHASIRATMHDGLMLPRLIRSAGGLTDLVDATPLASCRMYSTWREIWNGFGKNATEGMAKPVALPVWTVLLGGGHVLPYVLVPAAWIAGAPAALEASLLALGLVFAARTATALVTRQSALSVIAHPVGILVVLAIQWNALARAARGRKQATWRGRSYDVG